MAETRELPRMCHACGSANDGDAKWCASCGAALDASGESSGMDSADENSDLRYVDPNNRVELGRYMREDEAELACGLLRANRIGCELSSEVIPGLPTDLILWVDTRHAKQAWALLADAERQASGDSNAA